MFRVTFTQKILSGILMKTFIFRLCRRCGKIGHFAATCAEKIAIDRDRRRGDSESVSS